MKAAGLVLVSVVVFGLVACGGKDKPPLTPDDTDSPMGADGGTGSGDTPSATPPTADTATPAK